MTIDTLNGLVAALRDSGLLDEEQQGRISALAARFPNAAALARELQRLGWLTPYQTEELLAGRGGELVLGQYVILSLLGQGGMGKVFKARHRLMKRVVALKVIRPALLAEPRAVHRFHREIEAVSRLAHPNIVAAFDADQVGNTHFLVMEYVEGTDLARLVKEHGPLPAGLACDCIRQSALGLQHAHEQGMVHRDVKPANLLLAKAQGLQPLGLVKVLDLGLARLHAEEGDGLTHTGAVMGTPDYIAPEQASDSHLVDIRADLYSLGCTLYYLLTGEPPFPGGTAMEKLFKHQYVAPRPVEVRRPDLPPAVAAVVARLLAKRPEERYQTPAELAEALAPLSVFNPDDDASTIYLPKPPAVAEAEPGTIRPGPAGGETMHPEGGATRVDGAAPRSGSGKSPGDWSASPVPYVEPASPAGAVPALKLPPPRRRPPVLLAAALVLAGAAVVVAALALPSLSPLWRRPAPSGRGMSAEGGSGRTFATTRGDDSSKKETRRENRDTQRTTDTGKKPGDTPKEAVKPGEKLLPLGDIGTIAVTKDKTSAAFATNCLAMAFVTKSPEVYYCTIAGGAVAREPRSVQPYIELPSAPAVALSGDGERVFCGTWDHPSGSTNAQTLLKMWSIPDGGDPTPLWPTPSTRRIPWITCLAVSGDGNRVIVGTDDGRNDSDVKGACGLYLWDIKNIKSPKFSDGFDGHRRADKVKCVALSADGSRGVSAGWGDAVRWWAVEQEKDTGELKAVQKGFRSEARYVKVVAITPAGDYVLYPDEEKVLHFLKFDSPGRGEKKFKGKREDVTALALSKDGSLAVSGHSDGSVYAWDTATEESHPLRESYGHTGAVLAVAVSPDRKYAYSAEVSGTISRWLLPKAAPAPPPK